MKFREGWQYAVKFLAILLVYVVTARLGLQLDAVSGFATLVWPPTGIALATLFIFGSRYWPAVVLAAFLANYLNGAPPLTALAIGAGNSLEALAGSYWLRRYGFSGKFDHVRDAILFVVFGAVLNVILSATIGVTSLWFSGIVTLSSYLPTWIAWSIGDALGALVIGGLLINLATDHSRSLVTTPKVIEAASVFLLLVVFDFAIFSGLLHNFLSTEQNAVLIYVTFPLLIWVALRFTPRLALVAIALTSLIAVVGTIVGSGPFNSDSLSDSLISLQLFIGTVAITVLILAAAIAERVSVDRTKSEFVSLASHQLRSPLSTMKWYLDVLLAGDLGKFNKGQSDYIGELYHTNQRMIDLVNAFLNVSRIEMGTFSLKPQLSDVHALVQEVVTGLEHQARVVQIMIQKEYAPNLPKLTVDPELFKVVVQNLLSNSIKYSPERSTVELHVEHKDKQIMLSVSDQGCGIPPDQKGRVFTKLYRADNARAIDPEGSGLGLYITKSIVERSGGHIWYESHAPKPGTTFYVSLPVY